MSFIKFLLTWLKDLLTNKLLLIILVIAFGLAVNYFTVAQITKWIDAIIQALPDIL